MILKRSKRVATVNPHGAAINLASLNFEAISRSDGGWLTILNGRYMDTTIRVHVILSDAQTVHNIERHK